MTTIDKWHRQCVALQVDYPLTAQSVVDALNVVALDRVLPLLMTIDRRPHGLLGNRTASESDVR